MNGNNIQKSGKVSLISLIIGIVTIIAIIVLLIVFKSFKSKNNNEIVKYNKDEEAIVSESNITIKVNSVEEMYKDGLFFGENYVKVNITASNNGNEKVTIPTLFFDLITQSGETISVNAFATEEDGALASEINANSSITGNLWFETKLEKGMKLQYKTIINAKKSEDGRITGDYKKYTIDLN